MQQTYLVILIVFPGWHPLHLQYRDGHASTQFLYCAMVCMLIAVLHGVHSMLSTLIISTQLSSLCSKWDIVYMSVVGKDVNVQNWSDKSFFQQHR